ncbi:DUF982 domain-containing protein [Bosea sp. Tri-49]|uniref:DUF982 domain-containing protein n=1 Tax=Bosea sp. Tri-49 TaxID=1867715 RepID=UPI003FA473E0
MEAYMFLVDWPPSKRDPAHEFAIKACLAAMRGEVEAGNRARHLCYPCREVRHPRPDVAAFGPCLYEGPQGRGVISAVAS